MKDEFHNYFHPSFLELISSSFFFLVVMIFHDILVMEFLNCLLQLYQTQDIFPFFQLQDLVYQNQCL